MKKMLRKSLSFIMAAAMLGTSAAPVFAEDEKSFFNNDGLVNTDAVQQAIDENIASIYANYNIENDNSLGEINGFKYNLGGSGFKESDLKFFETLINNLFETENIDGKTYVTLDGKKYEYYLGEKAPTKAPVCTNSGVIPGNSFCYVAPEVFIPYKGLICPSRVTDVMFWDTNGAFMKINSDECSYIDAIELCYDFYWLQKDSIIFEFMFDIKSYYEKGYFGKTAVEDLTKEDIIRTLTYRHTIESYNMYSNQNQSVDDFAFDLDNNNVVDVKDLAIVTKYLIKQTDLTPAQKIVSSVDESCEPDIRTITKISRKIVGLE